MFYMPYMVTFRIFHHVGHVGHVGMKEGSEMKAAFLPPKKPFMLFMPFMVKNPDSQGCAAPLDRSAATARTMMAPMMISWM